ncbi:potential forkhead-like transcriptional regulator [Pseudozyma hubeiensis SY62]|uniref:Potential forkhead-like transcriptional regulator n=1 Tax=Pseudozyma hubeiensis (strain SY62) TaxID=1305764 RepID=R9P1J1_PSEHS|nr:potential forkhead-like transcriptional regulator [Pseudozyma hubeiensis SY62]GAC95106.1 potential forkhead-like transcriptional regulator [Pseudozyma hubeiensis SY62]
MLASLRPHSPPAFAVDRRSQQLPHGYFDRFSDDTSQPRSWQMAASGSERYTTPPPPSLRAAAHAHKPGSGSRIADIGPDASEQRPSPQSRQRSWHHPYMPASRAPQGPSPPQPLESGASPTSRVYDLGHPRESVRLDPQQMSPSHRSEHLHPGHEPRPRAGSRADINILAQPVNISSMPSNRSNVERIGGIGPSRNRGRSSTLSLPHPDTNRVRGGSFIGARHHSPYSGYDDSTSLPPRSWEEARSHRDLYARNYAGEAALPHRQSPTLRPSSGQSPILFAPLSPNPESHLLPLPSRMGSAPMTAKIINAGVMPRGHHHRSRPGTPVSPLNMDGLTMEDTYMPSASGMAGSVAGDRQRSPADARVGSDYFGPASSEWGRPSHMTSDVVRSPPSGLKTPGLRPDSRGHPYRTSIPVPSEGVPPEFEAPPYHAVPYMAGHPPARPFGRASVGTLPAHHHSMPRNDQMERERLIVAQQYASSQTSYHGYGHPHEHGYQSEFAPQHGRVGHAGGIVGAPPQHVVSVDRIAHSRRRRRPPYSYSSMITQAIASSDEGRMTLREIYTWISTNFSGYPMSGPDSQGWQNTVRHNLSLGKVFIKKARTAQDIYDSCSSGNPAQSQAARGKGGWWTLHPIVLSQIRSGQRTHNDEFDDLERLVDMDNAAAAASGGAGAVGVASPGSTDEKVAPRRSSADAGQRKSLTRQRSYSDSMDSTQAEQRRPSSGYQSSTAPVSRQGSINTARTAPAGRPAHAAFPVQPGVHGASSDVRPPSAEEMPSVLQRRPDLDESDRPSSAFARMRGHTIAMHETPSHQHASKHEASKLGGEVPISTRPPSGSVSSPRPLPKASRQMIEDVDMDMAPSVLQHRGSSQILQNARETLVSAQQQQQQQTRQPHHGDVRAVEADSPDSTGRMDIRGLLNG